MSGAVPNRVRLALLSRSGNRCERCGLRRRNGYGLHVSHRQARGMGGRREDWRDLSRWNILCGGCHLFFVERRPLDARDHGWKVPPGGRTDLWPCVTWQGVAFLTPDGAYAWPPVLART